MQGLQCTKSLYLQIHDSNLAREVSAGEQAIFDQGNEVGLEAQKRFPGGYTVEAEYWDFEGAIEQTKQAIKDGAKDIYEASFIFDDIFARIDILHKNGKAWDLIEVKSSTKVKDEHIYDVAIQKWILDQLKIKVKSCYVMHINNQCTYPNFKDLFTKVDVTDEVKTVTPEIEELLPVLKKVKTIKTPPTVDIGQHCDSPYECRFKGHCWSQKNLPELNVFNLPGMGQKAWQFYEQGKVGFSDLVGEKLTATQKRAVEAGLSKKRLIDKSQIIDELNEWIFPLYYLDFETISYAVPRFDGTRPYQQMPFQYSLHIQKKPCGTLKHFEHLHTTNTDPRRQLAESLCQQIGTKGSVVAYNKGFESMCLKKLAESYPDLSKKLLDIVDRLVDPLPIFRKSIYDSKFYGSFSIKYVAPAIIGKKVSYEGLNVSDGTLAQVAYNQMIGLPKGSEEKEGIIKDLLEYCAQDTLCMVFLVDWLFVEARYEKRSSSAG